MAKSQVQIIRSGSLPLIVAAIFPCAALAQQDEPTSIWGLQLGSAITTQLPECAKRKSSLGSRYESYDPMQRVRCFERNPFDQRYMTLRASPTLGIGAHGSAMLLGGNVEGAIINFERIQFSKAFSLMQARYGDPHATEIATYQSGAGARLEGRVYQWRWASVQVTLEEYAGTINGSVIIATTSALRAAGPADAASQAQKNKSDL